MAFKLTIPPSSPLASDPAALRSTYYAKITKQLFLVEEGTCSVVLSYKAIDENNLPVGDWLAVHPFPQSAPVMQPLVLMLGKEVAPYTTFYRAAAAYLSLYLADTATVEDLV